MDFEFLFLDVVLVSSKREIISFVNGIEFGLLCLCCISVQSLFLGEYSQKER